MSTFNSLKPGGYLRVLTSLLLIILCTCVRAQDIRLNVIVPTPPPVTWEAYLEFDADVRVIVTNVGATPHDLKLVPTLTSDRGLSAAFQPGYQPMSPLTVGPGETVNLTYRDLRTLFGVPDQSDIALEGISFDRLFDSETIPEGSYTLCVEARDFNTSEALSNNFGCAVFFVQQHEPPLIIHPYDGEVITALQPQFMNFLWSVTGVPGRTRYRFALHDLNELGLFNDADAFLLENVRPYFEIDDLIANNLAYDLALPPLTPGHRYAVQVSAYDPENGLLFAQGGRSVIHQFTYRNPRLVLVNTEETETGGPAEFQVGGPDVQTSMEACPEPPPIPPIPVPYPTLLTAGQTVSVGNHDLVLNTGGALPLAGTGRVRVESLNAWVNVSFTGLRVDTALLAYQGNVTATAQGNADLNNLNEAAALSLADLVDANDAWLGGGNGTPLNLPVGLAGEGMDLVMTGMNFTPFGATVDLFGKVELPEAQGSRRLLLVGQGACLNDVNLGANADLLLATDESFALEAGVEMTFAGGADGTRMRWNAGGIEYVDVDMSLSFAPSVMPEGAPFSARVTAQVEDYQNWMGTVTLGDDAAGDPLPTEDITFNYEKVEWVYDHSASANPDGMVFPTNHPDNGSQANQWQGLYLSQFDVIFPEGFDVAVAAENLLLDADGVWALISAQGNLLDIEEGEIGGWALGIDGLELDVRASAFHNPSFSGRVRLPLGPDIVAFTAPLGGGQNISIALATGQELEVDMWLADLELADNCTVGFTKVGSSYRPEARLDGSISVGWGSVEEAGKPVGLSQFSIPDLDFENFRIVGGPSPSVSGNFSLDNGAEPQGNMQNFPLQLTDFSLALEGSDIGLQFGVGLSLMDEINGFHGNTVFSLIGRLDGNRYVYDRTRLDRLSVEAELNLISLSGSIDIFDQHGTYGTGFDGQVAVDIEQIGAGLDMRLMVGRAPANFRYFMVDALVKLPDNAGIPIGPTPLAFFGFGGGFWRNMDRQASMPAVLNYDDLETVDQSENDPGHGATTVFLPVSGQTGFSMKTIVGLNGAKRALNGDLELFMEIEDDFSLNEINLEGNIYAVQDIGDRGDAFIHGMAELRLAPSEGLYTLSSTLTVDFPAKIKTVYQPLFAGFETQGPLDWWFYLGQWTPGADPLDDGGRFETRTKLNFGLGNVESNRNGYFMLGTRMPPGLPGVPDIVNSQFGKDGKELPGQQFNGTSDSYDTTNGFAFGMGRYMNLNFNARIFSLDVGYTWGFDLLLADYSNSGCSLDDFGLNNWYASGQAYAHCHINGSVKGRLFGETREFKFVELDAAALMQFQGPNPIWIKGNARIRGRALGKLIKFDTQVGFEFGEKMECRETSGGIFDEIPIVQEITPKKGMNGRSIFTAPEVSFNFPNGALPIDEGSGNSVDMKYYGYKINKIVVTAILNGEDEYTDFYSSTDPDFNYDEEGYAAIFTLPELPPRAKIKFVIEVQGLRYTGATGSTIEEYFNKRPYETTFNTGPPPDHIMKGSVVECVPFRRQLYFTKNDHPSGRIDWYRAQYSDLFRPKPNAEDKLDMAGNFNYVARFVRLDNGDYRDRQLTNINEESGAEFAIPRGWLQPEQGYRIDILRLYTAPGNSGAATDTALVDLGLYSGQSPFLAVGELGVVPQNNGNGSGSGGGGYGLVGSTQIMLFNQSTSSPGVQQMELTHTVQQGNGITQTASFSNGPDGNGPDPGFEPEYGFANEGTYEPPGDFANPGGSMEGLSRYSRELTTESRTAATVAKNLWPKSMDPWYFRTSKHNTLEAKINALDAVTDGSTRYRTVKVKADNLYYETNEYIHLPYVIFRADEPFDRYETKYWKRRFQARDKGQKVGGSRMMKFSPAVDVGQPGGQWRDIVFYGDPDAGSTNGLFREPLGDVDAWCDENFDHPENGGTTTPCIADEGTNAPLHHFQLHTWDAYMTAIPGPYAWGDNSNIPGMPSQLYNQWLSQTRYGADKPFGRNSHSRRFASPVGGLTIPDFAMIETTQWGRSGATPEGLAGSGAQSTNTFFNDGMVAAYEGEGQVNPNLGEMPTQLAGEEPQPIQMAQSQAYLTLTDFTEWVTLKDYFGMRTILSDGIDALLDADGDGGDGCDLIIENCNNNSSGDPSPPGPLPDLGGERSFGMFYHPQIRRWLMHKNKVSFGEHDADYHQYFVRPAGQYRVRLEGRTFDYNLPQLNAAGNPN